MSSRMQTLSTKGTEYGFGRLIDFSQDEPIVVTKHGRSVVVISVEEYKRLKALESVRAGEKDKSSGKTYSE